MWKEWINEQWKVKMEGSKAQQEKKGEKMS